MFETDTNNDNSITINMVLCETCEKRLHPVDDFQCYYCWNYYNDMKFYRCHSPNFVSRKWMRVCYKLHIPHNWIRFFFRGGRK